MTLSITDAGSLGTYLGTRVLRDQRLQIGTLYFSDGLGVLVVGDAPRYADPETEQVRRDAIHEAVRVVRVGLASVTTVQAAAEGDMLDLIRRPGRVLAT